MSATKRTKEERDASHDYYRTPRWCVEAIKPFLPRKGFGVETAVLDPCAGDGAILDAFCDEEESPLRSDRILVGFEVQADLAAKNRASEHCKGGRFPRVVTVRDALSSESWNHDGNVIMNPPFNLAEEFIRRAIREVFPHGGAVCALLRLAFIEGQERAPFHLEYPSEISVLPKRPSFCMAVTCKAPDCGHRENLPVESKRPKVCPKCGAAKLSISTSDASAYAWFTWTKKASSVVRILDVREDRVRASWCRTVNRRRVFPATAFAFEVDVPNYYPDGSPLSSDAAAWFTDRAIVTLDLYDRIIERGTSGVSGDSLERIFADSIEREVIDDLQKGVRAPEASAAAPVEAKAEKPKRARKSKKKADPLEPLEDTVDRVLEVGQ
jgi:hypothetical protein